MTLSPGKSDLQHFLLNKFSSKVPRRAVKCDLSKLSGHTVLKIHPTLVLVIVIMTAFSVFAITVNLKFDGF